MQDMQAPGAVAPGEPVCVSAAVDSVDAVSNEATEGLLPSSPAPEDAPVLSPRSSPDASSSLYLSKLSSLHRDLPVVDVKLEGVGFSARVVAASRERNAVPGLFSELAGLASCRSCRRRRVEKRILSDVSLHFAPGTSTLVLGAPSSGTSTLLKAIGGRLAGRVEGSVLCNDEPISSLRWEKLVSFCGQYDVQFADATASNMLEFTSRSLSGAGALSKLGLGALDELASGEWQSVIDLLGLRSCQDTLVGDEQTRGVSGGEKKRISIGEALCGPARVLLLDKYSTGLDSAMTQSITRHLCEWARAVQGVVVAHLLQPEPQVILSFDQLVVLESGRVIFSGRPSEGVAYFGGLGLVCPAEKDLGSFFAEVSTEEGRSAYRLAASPARPSGSGVGFGASEMASSFARSELGQRVWSEVRSKGPPALDRSFAGNAYNHAMYGRQSPLGFCGEFCLLLGYHFRNTGKNLALVAAFVAQQVLMGLLYGWMFFQGERSDYIQTYGVLVMVYCLLLNGAMPILMQVLFQRPMTYKLMDRGCYRSWMYIVTYTVHLYSIQVVQTLLMATIVYFMHGFTTSAAHHYFLFLLILILSYLVIGSMLSVTFYALDSLGTIMNVMSIVGLFLSTFDGIMITRGSFQKWLLLFYYVNPETYTLRGLAVNEFTSREYLTPDENGRTGRDYLNAYDMPLSSSDLWLDLWMLVVFHVLFVVVQVLLLEYRAHDPFPYSVSVEDPALEASPSLVVSVPSSSSSTAAAVVGVGKASAEAPVAPAKCVDVEPTAPSMDVLSASSSSPSDTEEVVVVSVSPPSEAKASPAKEGVDFQRVTFSFHSIGYSVTVKNAETKRKEEKTLLIDVSGFVGPGSVTALMGASGAGKTTLLDVIASRKTTGRVTGRCLINGAPFTEYELSQLSGYVEQGDTLPSTETVREALRFSASLRHPSGLSGDALHRHVDSTLETLGLESYADVMIGELGSGLPMGIRKLVMLGIELAANPSLIFLDEPTTGLDSSAALAVVQTLQRIAATGRSIICTIHQPSFEIFSLFSDILLLERGGRVVYFGEMGENGLSVAHYVESLPGAPPRPEGQNPSSYILEATLCEPPEVVEGDNEKETASSPPTGTLGGHFSGSAECARCESVLSSLEKNPAPVRLSSSRRASAWRQLSEVTQRYARMAYRRQGLNVPRLSLTVLISLVYGIFYMQLSLSTNGSVQSALGLLFSIESNVVMTCATTLMPTLFALRETFYRETAMRTYHPLTLWVALISVELLYMACLDVVVCAILYPLVGLRSGFVWWLSFWGSTLILMMTTECFVIFVSFALPSLQLAETAFVLILACILMPTSGYIIPYGSMRAPWSWVYWVNPLTYYLQAVAVDQFVCVPDFCPSFLFGDKMVTVRDYLADMYSILFGSRLLMLLGELLCLAAGLLLTLALIWKVRYLSR